MTAAELRPLDALPIAVDPAAIDAAMAPFIVAGGDNAWRRALRRRVRKAVRRSLARLTGSSRDRSSIEREYADAWGAGYDRYRVGRTDLKGAPWVWRGRKLLLDPAAAARIRAPMFAAVLAQLRPASVLEIGSGNGINLFALAGVFPQIRFTGVELTEEGTARARAAQGDQAIASLLQGYSPLPVRDSTALSRIEFVQGDAASLPFEDDSFDLVMTVLAVEQMEGIRGRALAEIARVARRHVLMLEPFRDANRTVLRRLYVHSRDYFRGSIGELADFGLKPVWATGDYPQEAFLGTALALSEKVTSSTA